MKFLLAAIIALPFLGELPEPEPKDETFKPIIVPQQKAPPRWGIIVGHVQCFGSIREKRRVMDDYESIQCEFPDGVTLIIIDEGDGSVPSCLYLGGELGVDYCSNYIVE